VESIARIYTDEIHDNLKAFYTTWPIGTPLELSDYGSLVGASSAETETLETRALRSDVRTPGPNADDYEYKSDAVEAACSAIRAQRTNLCRSRTQGRRGSADAFMCRPDSGS
jgi:hypothetical protein